MDPSASERAKQSTVTKMKLYGMHNAFKTDIDSLKIDH
jgi:hypothetical protein